MASSSQFKLGVGGTGSLEEAKGRVRDRIDGKMLEKEAAIPLPDSLRSSGLPIFTALVLK